jgi:hypothetical protein
MEGVEYCHDYADAVERLRRESPRRLLALTGVNSIARLKEYWLEHPTIFRILNRAESLAVADDAGFPRAYLIYYREDGELPSMEEEKDLMQHLGCDALLTKQSGGQGGFEAKVSAALQLDMKVFVIEAPRLPDTWQVVTGRHGLRRAIEQWVEEKRIEAAKDFDKVKDVYRKRAAVIGFRCGVIHHLLSASPVKSDDGRCIADKRESKATLLFALKMARYCMDEQIKAFGPTLQKQYILAEE